MRWTIRPRTIVPVFFLVAIAPLRSIAADVTINDIVDVARSTRELFHGIDFVFETTQRPLSGGEASRPDLIPAMRERMILDIRTRAYHWYKEEEEMTPAGKRTAMSEVASDNQVETIYLANSRSGNINNRVDPPESTIRKASLVVTAMMYPPKQSGLGVDDGSLISLLQHGRLRGSKESVEGRECSIVDAFVKNKDNIEQMYMTAWIDVERGALPLRVVGYDRKGLIAWDQRVKRVHQFKDGEYGKDFWFPVHVETTTRVRGASYEVIVKADPNRTFINPRLEHKAFVIGFPPGTSVYDVQSQKTFLVPGAPASPLSLGYPTSDSGPISRGRRPLGMLLVGQCGIGLVIVAGFAWRRRSRRNAGKGPGASLDLDSAPRGGGLR